MNQETKLIRTQTARSQNREHSAPLYLTSSFIFDDAEQGRAIFADELEGNIYSRYSNPNTNEFIDKICEMEGAEAGLAFSSGMAAVFASFAGLLKSGDHVVAYRAIFGSTHQLLTTLLPRWGINSTYVDAAKPDALLAAITPATKMIFLETPSNPGLELVDLAWLCKTVKQHYPHIIINVDNCFATPYLQKPIDYGVDIVSHSATKYMDGQGRVLGGVVVGKKELIKEMMFFIRHTGPAMSAFNAWLLSKSLETLPLRMDRHCSNALKVAKMLEASKQVEQVRYPHLPSHPQYQLALKQMKQGGGIVTFIIKGGFNSAKKFMDALSMILISSNLGDSRTIATHPASTTHAKLSESERQSIGIYPGSIRISVGLENIDDILNDIATALQKTS
ncbi:MAG: aminotransferase class I/II-fold pyridoxal phosphate-dependent enzyme [Sphingobacteriales bacterium]|nr:MAG: aminotransferase class I/II-fold pyridoxal phosphate-dependent enzyme [Sphingobacteriales bacterium]TAF78602.1 MAG: aminotransferase class I/II-fold pyridoxal phosphate-dependent enzyme [Sphingobacteriales bacterium]